MRRKDLKGEVNLLGIFSHEHWLKEQRKKTFPYHGVYCFEGKQGSSKTLSACRMISNIFLDYKDVYLITNVWLNLDLLSHIPKENMIPFTRYYQLFFIYNKPVIFFIDEAHLLFNSLESRNADVNMFAVISQNRKQKRVFILTSQVFSRLQLVMREQINTIIHCNTFFNYLSHCVVYHDFEKQRDELVGKREFGAWYTHKRNLHYKMYDTYQIIDYSKDSPFWTTRKVDDENGYFMEYKKYLKSF